MEKTFLLLVALLPMCSLFFQKIVEASIFGFRTLPNAIAKIEPTVDVKPNQL